MQLCGFYTMLLYCSDDLNGELRDSKERVKNFTIFHNMDPRAHLGPEIPEHQAEGITRYQYNIYHQDCTKEFVEEHFALNGL